MQTTKQQLLALLKRAGSATVEEAAGALSVASMTARQHLIGLERDGFISTTKVRRAKGRPHYLYTLTPKGQDLFPHRYDLFAQVLLEEAGLLQAGDIEGLTQAEKRSLLVHRTAARLAERYRVRVEGSSLEARVAAVTDVLHLIGGFAEWCSADSGFEIRDYNCVFARLVPTQESGCEWHVALISQLLQWPVTHELLPGGRVDCCRYLIPSQLGRTGEGLLINA
jgi:predicted ArsR family transcriptional regulator